VAAKLAKNGIGVPGARVYGVVRDVDQDQRWPEGGYEVTNEHGLATLRLYPEGEAGATVYLDVFFLYEGETYRARTSIVIPC
jgi:hypothetical protein